MEIIEWIPPDAKLVLELGCGAGEVGRTWLARQPDGSYIGVEENVQLAHSAAGVLTRVHALNPRTVLLPQVGIFDAAVDCLVVREKVVASLADLEEFAGLLEKCQNMLCDDGCLVLEIPNARFLGRLKQVLSGDVQRSGAFLWQDIQKILQQAGLFVTALEPFLRGNENASKMVTAVLPYARSLGVSEEAWRREALMASFFVRVSIQPPPEPLLIQTMLGELRVCARVRVQEPDAFLNTLPNVKAIHKAQTADLFLGAAVNQKVLIRQRIWADLPEAAIQQRRLLELGYVTVAEIDDDPERWLDFHGRNNFFAFRGSHAVQVSTLPLAQYLQRWNPYIAVFPNQLAQLPPVKEMRKEGPVRIFFGALNREEDWKPYLAGINAVLRSLQSDVEIIVVHDRKLYEALETKWKHWIPFCPYEQYMQILRSCDIAWLPLEDTQFNRMKSDLKFLECAGQQVAVLASPTVYAGSVCHGKTGLIYRNQDEFCRFLLLLVQNVSFRKSLIVQAYKWVSKERLLCQHYRKRYAWYRQLIERKDVLTRQMLLRAPEISELP